MTDLICISHLRWDFVWQRPQHLLARLGKRHRIFFVEEPVAIEAGQLPCLEVRQEPNNVTVIRLCQPMEQAHWLGHGDASTELTYQKLLNDYLHSVKCVKPLLWLYTPMAWHFAEAIPHEVLIYDVMDELSAFKGAPEWLRDYDARVLAEADLVFTGGLSLYNSRYQHNSCTYLFSSGVEIDHFATAAQRDNVDCPPDIAHLSAPILGYYGVIDERMDLDLLAQVAQMRPDWQIVLIGPTAKIAPEDLPQAPNLHYLGMKTYQQLPDYLAFFDVALVPFAISEATRYLSPTKTLEYMAAHKPIVSTPIQDIVALYGSIVYIAQTPEAFVAQVEAALQSNAAARYDQEQKFLLENTWDNIVAHMSHLIQEKMRAEPAKIQEEVEVYEQLAGV